MTENNKLSPTPGPHVGGTIACPCTTFEQDEECRVGFPSLLCSACGGKGDAPMETVVALAAEMLQVAEQLDELEDPFAAWESIELWKSHGRTSEQTINELRKRVENLEKLVRWAHDTLYEINLSNYDHDEVCKLNDASVEVILGLAPALGETHGKSAEFWKARAALSATAKEGK